MFKRIKVITLLISVLLGLGAVQLISAGVFINALNNEDKWVRYLAAEALGNMGDLRSIAYLDLLRSDKDPDLRFVSGQSLSKIAYLREILADPRKMGCDTCLIRYIAEEVLVQRNCAKSA